MMGAPRSSVLFVCTGNICRSPMAEYLFRQLIRGRPGLVIDSASCGAHPVLDRATEPAVHVMREFGIDMSGHRSRALSATLLESNPLVLTMEAAHKRHALLRGRAGVFTLYEYASGDRVHKDIDDPYGGTLADYRDCAAEIASLLPEVLRRIVNGA